jgi:hypothetical protein
MYSFTDLITNSIVCLDMAVDKYDEIQGKRNLKVIISSKKLS